MYSKLQEDEWQMNETYMDNISKYPKDWYKQITRKKRTTEQHTAANQMRDKKPISLQQDKAGKEIKDKQEASDGRAAGESKSEEEREAVID